MQTNTTMPASAANPMNHLDVVWRSLAAADRLVLLGHDRDTLDAADKIRLAKQAAALRRNRRGDERGRR